MAKSCILIPTLTEKNKRNFLRKISPTPTATGCLEWLGSKSGGLYGSCWAGGMLLKAHRVAYFLATGVDPKELHVCHTCDNPSCVNFEHLWLGTDEDNARDRQMKGRGNAPSGDRHGSRTKPERVARGDRNGARLHPERLPRGENHYSRLHPEWSARGDKNGSRTRPECLARGDRHGSRTRPERTPRGDAHGMSKLTAVDIPAIRSDNRRLKDIAADYGVSNVLIGCVKRRKIWKHVA